MHNYKATYYLHFMDFTKLYGSPKGITQKFTYLNLRNKPLFLLNVQSFGLKLAMQIDENTCNT